MKTINKILFGYILGFDLFEKDSLPMIIYGMTMLVYLGVLFNFIFHQLFGQELIMLTISLALFYLLYSKRTKSFWKVKGDLNEIQM